MNEIINIESKASYITPSVEKITFNYRDQVVATTPVIKTLTEMSACGSTYLIDMSTYGCHHYSGGTVVENPNNP